MRILREYVPGSVHYVFRIHLTEVRLVQEIRVFNEAEDLTNVRERLLPEGLWVTDVAVTNSLPLFLELLRPEYNRSSNGILCVEEVVI